MRNLKLEVSLSRNYGPSSITFSISEIVDIESDAGRMAAFDNLTSQLIDQHEHYASEYLHRTLPPVDDAAYKQVDYGKSVHPVERLTRKVENGKTLYRVHCGKWKKYGALLYPEVAEKYDVAAWFGDEWEVSPPDLYATIDETGKSPKVVHFTKG